MRNKIRAHTKGFFYNDAEYNKAHHDAYWMLHREQMLKQQKAYYRKHPENNRNWSLQRKFKITLEDYKQINRDQNSRCAICRKPEKNQGLAVDHCHKTGLVRGLLCGACNKGLGYFRDNPKTLRKAALYVKNPRVLS
jgi:hypothetical protein